jgi:hypothetical protein
VAADHLLGHFGLELVQHPVIEEALEEVRHVVGHPMVLREDVVQLLGRALRLPDRAEAVLHAVEPREPTDVFADPHQALGVGGGAIVRHGADFGMSARPTQEFAVHRLAGGALHEVGPPSPMKLVPSTMKITSDRAGR